MKNPSIIICFILSAILPSFAKAQLISPSPNPSDTFRIQNYPLKVWYGPKQYKKMYSLEPIVLSKNDFSIKNDWGNSKVLKGAGLGAQILGVAMMGISLSQSANGEDSGSSLLVGGATISLGGVLVQIAGVSKAKRAMRRYNSLHLGQLDAIPTVLKPDAAIENSSTNTPGTQATNITNATPQKEVSKGLPTLKGNMVIATSTGMHNGIYGQLSDRNTVGFSSTTYKDQKNRAINFAPNFGYFVSDGFLVGLNFGVASLRLTNSTSNTVQTRTQLVVGPFVRYYGNLPASPNLKWTAEAMIGFGSFTYKLKNGTNVTENKDGLFSLGLGPGIAYFFNDKVSVEAAAVYERVTEKDKENKVEESLGGIGLRIGVSVFL